MSHATGITENHQLSAADEVQTTGATGTCPALTVPRDNVARVAHGERLDGILVWTASALRACPARDLEAAISNVLERVCSSLCLDRAAVFEGTETTASEVRIRCAWARPGVVTPTECLPRCTAEAVGRPAVSLLRGEPVRMRRDALGPDAAGIAALMDRTGSRVAAIVPLHTGATVNGCISFEATRTDVVIDDSELRRLQLLAEIVSGALERRQSAGPMQAAQQEHGRRGTQANHPRPDGILGDSAALRGALEWVAAVAPTSSTVVLRGESGVGKELFARAIHRHSRRANGPLVRVNCASIPTSLFESEFFGHVRGSFTGALRDRRGRFELAHRGTIFLDEIAEIPYEVQSKLLRVLQEREFERIGDDRTQRVDVRIIAATNKSLEAEVEAGRFRRDLYYRLSVFSIEIPPLRMRREDIIPLAEHFLASYAAVAGRPDLRLHAAAHERLLAHDWPGNVRELQNVIERAVILSPRPPLRLDLALEDDVERRPPPPPTAVLTAAQIADIERENIARALELCGGRVAGAGGAAERLGMKPSTLRDRLRRLGLRRR